MPRRPGPALLVRLALLAACWPLAAPLHAQGRVDHVPGVVRGEAGEAVRSATIVAQNPRAKPHLFATTSDGDGNFYLSGLTPGPWTFTVTAQGYMAIQRVIMLEKGRRSPLIELIMRKGQWQPPPPLQEGRLAGVNLFQLMTALQNADTLMRARQYDQAIAIYQEVLTQAPALTRANLAIAEAWRMKKDLDRSVAAYRQVLAAEPGNEMAIVGLSGVEVDRGAFDEAERLLGAAASWPKPGREVLCAMGDVKLARQQPAAAADWYAKAAQADPAWARPPLKLGLLAASRGESEAVGLLEKAIRLGPGSPEAEEAARALSALKK